MTNGKYVDYNKFDPDIVNKLLRSTNVDDKLDALLFTVLGSGDYEKSDQVVLEFSQSTERNLKVNAIGCVGHLARIHKKINLDTYLPILDSIIKGQNHEDELIGRAEDALNDIWVFCDKKEIMEFKNEACVSRFFLTLAISHDSEKEEKYEEGIRRIKELKERETNPSVKNIQETTITYLSHFV